jgi:hypothetical protein
MRFRGHVYDLIESAADEVHELKFGDGAESGQSRPEGSADDRGFGDGRVDDSLGAEAVNETIRNFESSTVDADVFAETEDGRVALHFLPDALADGFEVGEDRHEEEVYITRSEKGRVAIDVYYLRSVPQPPRSSPLKVGHGLNRRVIGDILPWPSEVPLPIDHENPVVRRFAQLDDIVINANVSPIPECD